jgi:hypothetical protein
MAAAPKASHQTAKQHAASVANLRKARAVARKLPRTAKQKNASRHNLAKARAAQKSRRSGKTAVAPKKAAAHDSRETSTDSPTGRNIHLLPVCAPVALAAHLLWWTGTEASDEEILALHRMLGDAATIPGAIEAAAEYGFCGFRPDSWARCDVSTQGVPGLMYGLAVPTGYHAVLALPAGVLSWGTVLSWPGEPAEAWHLEWKAA